MYLVNYYLAYGLHLAMKKEYGDDNMHTMTLINEHEGTEEWLCPSCGRHLLVSWFPKFKRTVLEDGDSSSAHSGFKNDLQADELMAEPVLKNPQNEDYESQVLDARLVPWIMWMDEVGFETLWDTGVQ
jgi:hypothetical protein